MVHSVKKIKNFFYIPFYYIRSIFTFGLFPSEFGEDKILKNLFKYKKGFYIDIGCHHPLKESNTYYLFKKLNWRGINVDMSKKTINLFNKLRPNDLNINAAIGKNTKLTTGYFFDDLSCFNTLSLTKAKEIERQLGYSYFKRSLSSISPKDLINKNNVKEVDFLNIDIEGLDQIILDLFPFDVVRPKVIAFESHKRSIEKNINNMNLLNYFLVSKCGPTFIFIDKKKMGTKVWPHCLTKKL
tara:strand:- start:1445 stop:2167 length:723 start_codon:yes stop_codon:yes gene_type:complete